MSIKHVALTAIALAAAGSAAAQTSTVTIYGVADAFVQVANGDETLTRLQSGGLAGSRIGFRGTEDLGGGLRALFNIESGINLDDGTNGQNAFWGRQAFVGLGSSYGTLTLGRQYSSLYAASGDFSAFSNGSYGPSTAVLGGFGGYEPVRGSTASATGNGGPARVNNSIKYDSPSFSGFRVGALWGLGEVAGGTGDTRVIDVYGRYTAGPFDAIVSLVDDRAEATDADRRTITLGGAYSFGAFRVLGGYMDFNDRSDANADGKGYWIGGDYRFGQNLVRAQYVVNKPDGSEVDTQAFGVGFQHDLSKRTALYTSLTQFRNDDGVGRWHGGVPADLISGDDNDITEFVVGVRHSF